MRLSGNACLQKGVSACQAYAYSCCDLYATIAIQTISSED